METNKIANMDYSEFEGSVREYLLQMQLYNAAIKEVKTKLEILDEEFSVKHEYNPIHNIESRLKSPRSIIEKLKRKGLEVTVENINAQLKDVAGIRVICNYVDDVFRIAKLLTAQDDIKLIEINDYITNPKSNGYRSLHLVVEVPIFLAHGPKPVSCEVQIRTIAMDFWASLEHKLRYKRTEDVPDELKYRLKHCAETIYDIDCEMQNIHKEIKNVGTGADPTGK